MINNKIIINILGLLLIIESVAMAISIPISIYYGEDDTLAFIYSALLTFCSGGIMWYITHKADKTIGKREGFVIVSTVWVVFSIFGSLPFILSGYIPTFSDAFFETMSGFTTTGASIIDTSMPSLPNGIETLPHGLLLWRSMTQWLGGMGIIVLSLAILPILGIGGMQLFIAEVPGPTPNKISPKVQETARKLWGIYILYTILETILLMLGDMSLFDAINHSFTTLATGGYSTKNASIAHYNSAYIEYVIIIFMFLAGTNFTLSFFALSLKFGKIWKNEEFRNYFLIILLFTITISIVLTFTETNISYEKAFRDSLFQVVSLITTTGYATADFLTWEPVLGIICFMLLFFGGSAGSTGGGMKIIRIVLLAKNGYLELKRLIHPNAIIPVRLNARSVDTAVISNVLAFIVLYIMIFVLSTIILSAMGLDMEAAMGSAATAIGNVGPGIGTVGPSSNFQHIPDMGKWFMTFLMLCGRLELFTVIILFSPAFWKK